MNYNDIEGGGIFDASEKQAVEARGAIVDIKRQLDGKD